VTYTVKNIDVTFKKVRGDYDEKEMFAEFTKVKCVENTLRAYTEYCYGKKTIIFNVNIAHSKIVYDRFVEYGLTNVRHLDGTSEDRERILEWFKNTDDAILCNVGVLTKGFDEPTIRNVIINRATTSLPLWLQMTGRGSRPIKDTKDQFTIIDLGGNARLHGDWDLNRDWENIFYNPTEYKECKGVAPIKECAECKAIIPAQALECKFCGHIHVKEIQYDAIILELEKVQKNINVEYIYNAAMERNYKPYKPFFDILTKVITNVKYKGNDLLFNEEFKENQYKMFLGKVQEWCKFSNRTYGKSIKDFSREQFDLKYKELINLTGVK
jgi:superfamily II DNA or RNA helicase